MPPKPERPVRAEKVDSAVVELSSFLQRATILRDAMKARGYPVLMAVHAVSLKQGTKGFRSFLEGAERAMSDAIENGIDSHIKGAAAFAEDEDDEELPEPTRKPPAKPKKP